MKKSNKHIAYCDCDCTTLCPNGKTGMNDRCKILKDGLKEPYGSLVHEALHTSFIVHDIISCHLKNAYELPKNITKRINKLTEDSYRLYQEIGKLL